MKRENKKGFGLIGTQVEFTNSEMDTLVRLEARTSNCLKSFDTEKPEFFVKKDYRFLQKVLRIIIGEYVNNEENAFEDDSIEDESDKDA